MKKNAFFLILVLLVTSCTVEKYKTTTHIDTNGFTFKTVSNDPLNTRIYELDNGLTIYLTQNHDQPRIAALINVNAGSVHEEPDATGLAHYLEHMMFKGTSQIGTTDWEIEKKLLDSISSLFEQHRFTVDPVQKREIYAIIDHLSQEAANLVATNEYDKLYTAIGASSVNAGTSYERTVYMCEIPSNELERWAMLERERFTDPVLRLFHTELEVVYEEFNMYQDSDQSRARNEMMAALFPNHPYGRDIIGLPDHLKNPSMVQIHDFLEKFYTPENMAIILSGDLEFESTIKLINDYFGDLSGNAPPESEIIEESPIEEPIIVEVTGPDAENIMLAFRFNGKPGSDNDIKTSLISQILSNRQAGLIDLNLVQSQKVLSAGSYSYFLNEYGIHVIHGRARDGQTLEEVKSLLKNEIENIKSGDFEEWLIEAVVNQRRIQFMRALESPFNAAFILANQFSNKIKYAEMLKVFDRMSKVTKEEIITFANENYHNNYVVVYKRHGDNDNLVRVEKPNITTIPVNRDLESDFATNFLNIEQPEIEPVFVNFQESIEKSTLVDGVSYYHVNNTTNNLFNLIYIIDKGKKHNLKFPLAIEYLKYLGTDTYTPDDLQREFFRYGLSFNVNAGDERCYVSISGLNDQFEKAVELMEHMIHSAKSDSTAYSDLIEGIQRQRSDAKMNQGIIMNTMIDFGLYGDQSPAKHLLSIDEMRSINPDELTALVRNMTSYQHRVHYYGPSESKEIVSQLKSMRQLPDIAKELPTPIQFKMRDLDNSEVFLVDYDISQANIILAVKDVTMDPAIIPYSNIFNSYFGSGLSSVVFQEIREARALAYAAYAFYQVARTTDEYNALYAYIGTQPDKLNTATEAMIGLLNEMPRAERQFQNTLDGIIRNINTQRISQRNLFWSYLSNSDRGIDYDIRKDTYNLAKTITLDELYNFFETNISNKNYSFLILGKEEDIDKNEISKLGSVEVLDLSDLFGY